MSNYLYCGKCDTYTPTETIYGTTIDVCGNCGRPALEVATCPGCDIEFPAIEEVDGFHSLECKQLSEGADYADSLEG